MASTITSGCGPVTLAIMAASVSPFLSKAITWLVICALVATVAVWSVEFRPDGKIGQPDVPPAAHQELQVFTEDLQFLTKLAKRSWSYREHRQTTDGVDVDALEQEALAALGDAPTKETFLGALTRYIAGLHDGHAGVRWSGCTLDGPRRLPFSLADTAEGVVVVGTTKAHRQYLGSKVVAIEGRPVQDLIQHHERHVFASTDAARRVRAIRRLAWHTQLDAVKLRLVTADGKQHRVTLQCPEAKSVVPTRHLRLWQREAKILEPGIGYFRPASFNPPSMATHIGASAEQREQNLAGKYAELKTTMTSFAGTRALVLDLRGNPGGTDLLGQELAGHLLDAAVVYFRLQSRKADGGWHRISSHKLRSQPGRKVYGGAVICLIDDGTFSVADNLAACLRDNHADVTFVGRQTGAGTGAPRWFTLPGTGAEVKFCTMRVYSPKGGLIEGHGTSPDVPVQWTRKDHLSTTGDPDLEAALKIARAKAAKAK
ncbi:MAG: S41 family peptidase [Planctomycetota bacterium]